MKADRAEVIKVAVSRSGQTTVVIRCPHCGQKHFHGGKAGGHRVAHCAGRRAEKLRRVHEGVLSYTIDQRDIDRHS